ncbi:MAG: hypothetical protein ACJAY8_000326 [Sphingobacteriales bacterium]|jgi:uncharacterized protein YyaL (SSP411 family)
MNINVLKLVFLFLGFHSFLVAGQEKKITWLSFDQSAFEKADQEGKFILLHLGANWCHWCHVMEDSTYKNKEVVAYLDQYYVSTHEDQDERLDLSVRYRDYGWPATIVFNSKGEEIVKRRGFMNPEPFLNLLKAIQEDPSPELEGNFQYTSVAEDQLFLKIKENSYGALDFKVGGYNHSQKFVPKEPFDLAFFLNDKKGNNWINTSLIGAQNLIDPVWGGIYQYSTDNDWNHHHFEKLLDRQGRYIEMYSKAQIRFNNSEFGASAQQILNYVDRFLNPKTGSLLRFNSQDADLIAGEHSEGFFQLNNTARLKQGIPRIDSNLYTGNNAKLAKSLFYMGLAQNNLAFIDRSKQMTEELLLRKMPKGYFQHKSELDVLYFLEDQVEMLENLMVQFQWESSKQLKKELNQLVEGLNQGFWDQESQLYRNYIGKNPLKSGSPEILNHRLGIALFQAAYLLGDAEIETQARNLLGGLKAKIPDWGYNPLLAEVLDLAKGNYSIVIWGDTELKREASNIWVDYHKNGNGATLYKVNYNEEYPSLESEAFYLCEDKSCGPPKKGVAALINSLKN